MHGLEAAIVAFSIRMLKTHGHCLVWKICCGYQIIHCILKKVAYCCNHMCCLLMPYDGILLGLNPTELQQGQTMIMFFLLSASWRTWFHSVAAFLKTKTCKIHIIICLCMGFITYPVLTFYQRVRKIDIFFKTKLSWGLGWELPLCIFHSNVGNTCYFLVWKIMLW